MFALSHRYILIVLNNSTQSTTLTYRPDLRIIVKSPRKNELECATSFIRQVSFHPTFIRSMVFKRFELKRLIIILFFAFLLNTPLWWFWGIHRVWVFNEIVLQFLYYIYILILCKWWVFSSRTPQHLRQISRTTDNRTRGQRDQEADALPSWPPRHRIVEGACRLLGKTWKALKHMAQNSGRGVYACRKELEKHIFVSWC